MFFIKLNCGAAFFLLVCLVINVFGRSIKDTSSNEFTQKFYTREDWGAVPATDKRPIKLPVPYVIIHHTYIPGACNTTKQCTSAMRSMQHYHMSMDWGDIGYHFCVGSEGGAYEGRGWNVIGIHARQANNFSIGICLIGDWRYELPPKSQLETTKALIATGLNRGIISPDYKLIGHNQATTSECPGTALLDQITTWPHYVPEKINFSTIKSND